MDPMLEFGEGLLVPERMIVAPSVGVFRPVELDDGAHLTRGHYHLECHVVHNPTSRILSRLRPAGALTVDESRTWAGVADLEIACTIVT